MKVFLQVGKAAVAVFWLLVLANLVSPLNKPVDGLLDALGALVLLAHVLELWLFGSRLRGLPNANLQRAQVLLFGIFHLYNLAAPVAAVASPEVVADAAPEPVADLIAAAPAAANDDTQVQHA
ncbi:MAG: DUF1145 domain-containing protein [Pseudomonas sp.]